MQVTNIRVQSCGRYVIVGVTGSSEFITATLQHSFWQTFIPDFSFEITEEDTSQDILISEGDVFTLDLEPTPIHAVCTPTTVKNAIVVAYHLLEVQHQLHSEFTLHGSVIAKNNSAVAFIGNISGLGKTSLAAHASTRGWDWVADEKFVVDSHFTFLGGIREHLSDGKTKNAVATLHGHISSNRETYPVREVCIALVSPSTPFVQFSYDAEKITWHLYDEVTRDIRAVNGIIRDSSVPLPSFDTTETATNRQRFTADSAQRVKFSFIQGSVNDIVDYLESSL